MRLRFWRDNPDIDAMARAIADDLYSHVQPDAARNHLLQLEKTPPKQQRKIEQKMTDVVLQVQRFSKAKSLGVYGKARLQQKFNERLEELGYDSDAVQKLSETILLKNV